MQYSDFRPSLDSVGKLMLWVGRILSITYYFASKTYRAICLYYITCFRTFRRKWLPSGGGIDVLHNLFRKFSRAFRDTEILLHRNSKLRGFQSGLEMWMSTTERVYARHHARRMNVLDSIPGGGWGKSLGACLKVDEARVRNLATLLST